MNIQEKIWKVIRGLGSFTVEDVVTLTEVKSSAVSAYLSLLHKTGYLRLEDKRKTPRGRSQYVFRLVKNTGPKAPLQRRCMYDPNLDALSEVRNVA